MNDIFQIGDFCFRLACSDGLLPPQNFMRFAVERGEPAYRYTLRMAE